MSEKVVDLNVKAKEETPYYVSFKSPYTFEGKEYKGIDLAGLDQLKAEDIYEVNKQFSTEAYITPRPEVDPQFCAMVASRVCSLPHEFFNGLSAKDSMKIRDVVSRFFLSED